MRRVVGSAGLGGRDESKSPYARLGFITSGRGALNVTCRRMHNVPNPIAGFGSGAKLGLCLRLVTNPTSGFGFGAPCMPLGD
jgi:hypothetical protein